MRTIPTFLSALVLLWAVSAALRSPLAWPVPTYIVAHSFFVLGTWLTLRKVEDNGSSDYRWMHGVSLFGLLVLAMVCAGYLMKGVSEAQAAFQIISGLFFAAGIAQRVYSRLLILYTLKGLEVPGTLSAAVWQASILTFCGYCALLSLFDDAKPEVRISALCLGLFWLLIGVFLFAYCVGIIRTYTVFDRLNYYIPPVLACLLFGLLAWRLCSLRIGPVAELSMVRP